MILADAHVWIEFFRAREPGLRVLLANNQVLMHPCLVAELALGSLHNRSATLAQLDSMPQATVADLDHIRRMIEARALHSKGIGLTDAHLVASCLLTPGARLWTRDAALRKVAVALGIAADLP